MLSLLTWPVGHDWWVSHPCGNKDKIISKRNKSNNNKNNNSNANSIVTHNCQVVLTDIYSPNNSLQDLHKTCGNGEAKHIYLCKYNNCKLRKQFFARNDVVSSCTKRVYECITPPGSVYIDCNTPNVIYLITCNNCSLQYVGETVQRLNERFTGHRQGMKSPEKHGTCKILTGHFNKGSCKGAEFSVQILEKIEGNGRTDRGAIDATQTAFRKQRELHWMLKLRTVYPYGLNDRIGMNIAPRKLSLLLLQDFQLSGEPDLVLLEAQPAKVITF